MKKIASFTLHILVVTTVCFILLWALTSYAGIETPPDGGVDYVDSKLTEDRTVTVKNDYGELSAFSSICGDRGVSFIYGELQNDDVALFKDLMVFKSRGVTEIDYYINSHGGSAWTGFALSGMIKWAQSSGFKLKAYAGGIIASAAVPVFLSFDNRTAFENTVFMIHEASTTLQGSSSEFRSQNTLFDLLRDQYFKILTTRTNIKDRETWETWERKTEWIGYDRAVEIGIIPEEK